MNACQHQMALAVDDRALVLGLAPPEDEDEILALAVQCRDHGVGKGLPPLALMRSGAAVLDRQAGIQQQHALPRPAFQIAVSRVGDAEIRRQFLVDVLQRRRRGNAMRHRKAQPVRLSGAVIGVLPQDHHLHLVERCQLEGAEDLASRRVDAFAGGLFGPQEIAEPGHMRRGKLGAETGFPARLDPDVLLLGAVV